MRCPICSESATTPLLNLGDAAIFCNVQWSTREEALRAPRGPIELTACPRCGHVFNSAFDPALVAYAPGYENSQHASTVFAGYAEKLVERLIGSYVQTPDNAIVDIGCGRGDLLAMLTQRANGRGFGFDPSYHDTGSVSRPANVTIAREYFGREQSRALRPALVCCRHVLEHVADPVGFLTEMRGALAEAGDPVLYLEVPNGTHLFRSGGVWDVLYEHYSYFSAHSLELALRKAGFDVLKLYADFGEQFLCVDARVAKRATDARVVELTHAEQALPVDGAGRMAARIEQWKAWAGQRSGQQGRVTVWGAGSKGVMFLNLVGLAGDGVVDTVIDQNPAKDRRYVSGTGQRISLPTPKVLADIEEIVLMNSIYAQEVESKVLAMNGRARLLFADQ
jgi:SAM-dependent methyltransferase